MASQCRRVMVCQAEGISATKPKGGREAKSDRSAEAGSVEEDLTAGTGAGSMARMGAGRSDTGAWMGTGRSNGGAVVDAGAGAGGAMTGCSGGVVGTVVGASARAASLGGRAIAGAGALGAGATESNEGKKSPSSAVGALWALMWVLAWLSDIVGDGGGGRYVFRK